MLGHSKTPSKTDKLLFYLVLILTLFGVLMVFESSSVVAFQDFSDKFYYVKQQAAWAIIGLLVMIIISRIDYRIYKKYTLLLLILNLFLLVIVLIPGIGLKLLGARRWLNMGFFSFQPAEMSKIILTLFLASYFSHKSKIWPFILIIGLFSFLIMLEPDLGTTVVIVLIGLIIFFSSGASLKPLISLLFICVVTGITLIFSSAYRKERFLTFMDPNRDPLGASYHINQILMAIGSGGWLGLGIGASRQKYAYLPEANTDSIFAVIAEEFGFIGCLLFIFVILLIVRQGLSIAKNAPDRFGQLLAVGITGWIGGQAIVNLAAMVVLVPLTGVPLPFVSYGGSSLVMLLAGTGILLNISRHIVKNNR